LGLAAVLCIEWVSHGKQLIVALFVEVHKKSIFLRRSFDARSLFKQEATPLASKPARRRDVWYPVVLQ
jgi:hypothetical protein